MVKGGWAGFLSEPEAPLGSSIVFLTLAWRSMATMASSMSLNRFFGSLIRRLPLESPGHECAP